jgi:hypothetical protein
MHERDHRHAGLYVNNGQKFFDIRRPLIAGALMKTAVVTVTVYSVECEGTRKYSETFSFIQQQRVRNLEPYACVPTKSTGARDVIALARLRWRSTAPTTFRETTTHMYPVIPKPK